ncbi:restriction endonuclease subunit S [Chryseosolibacter indicus]|uniref:Restriction endonuclease subunit S n=1 Tax=Chryseosolibacter indicus TaxID=2782351 RepID=A0ABS5VY38_9BACT|nr:restriction endonuclease subunit S [Chryseosolibacter indicus]MBT1706329.1 restriction endonuclease subunit S [Chryseosolibacter indicus]
MSGYPKHWQILPLEKCVDILDNKRIPVNADERAKRQGDVPYYGATGQAGWIDDFIFDEELVLLGEDGAPFFEKEKNVAFMVNGKSWVNNHAHVLKARSGITLNLFVLHYLNHFDYTGFVGGTTRLKLTQGSLKVIPFPVPPLPEQKRIVAKLDKLFAHLDQLKARLEKIPDLLKQFRQAVLTQAVTGKLTEEWRQLNFADVEVELRKLGIDWMHGVDGLPEQWKFVKFGNYVENFDGRRKPISTKERENKRGNFPYYGATGIIDTIDGYTHDGENLLIGEDGANLLSRVKPQAFITQGKVWVNNHAHVVRSKGDFVNSYLAYFINSIDLSPYVTGSAQPKLTQSKLNSIPVAVPPSLEQKEIVLRVESLFAVADRIEARYKTLQEKIDQLPQAILSKAFRGELVKANDEEVFEEIRSLAAEVKIVYARVNEQ